MSLVLGIDPGSGGAFALYDTKTRRIIGIEDMPVWYQRVGKSKRKRVDAITLAEMFSIYELLGIDLVVLEAVGGRGKQPGSSGFVFGFSVGLVYMAMITSRLVIETVPPATWKKLLNVPGKTKADDTAILARADELFPEDRALFRGKNGGKRIDRAEAAMMAKFGADHVLQLTGKVTREEKIKRYHDATVGA